MASARTVLLNLVGNDRVSGTLRGISRELSNASDETSRLSKAMTGLNKVGKIGGLATSAAGMLALSKAAAPATAAIAALPAAMVAAQVASKTLKLGMVGVGDAMSAVAEGDAEALNEALEKLSPNAKAFVKQAQAMRKEVVGLQQSVQDRLFQGLSGDMDRLGRSLLPTARTGMVGVAGALNGLGREAAATASTPWFRGQVAQVFAGTTGVVRTLQGAVRPLIESVLRLTVAGFPLVQRFTAWAVQGIRAGAAWLKLKTESGALQATLTGVGNTMARLGGVGGNLIRTIGNITGQTRAMGDAGGSTLVTLERLTGRMEAWSASAQGQQTAANAFRTLGETARQVATVLPLLLSPLTLIAKAVAGMPPGLQEVVGKMIGWSIIIGVVANRLKILTGVTVVWTAATKAATIAMTALRLTFGAAGLMGFVAGLRNVNVAMAASATTAQRLGAAIRAQIILWRAQAAAAGVSTARIIAQAAAQRVAAAATRVWAAAQWLWNAAMTANPIGLIIVGIVALGAALVLAYKKSETFRNIVNAAFNGIKVAVGVAWNFIKPIFNIYKWYIVNVLGTALKWYWAYVKFVWTVVSTVIKTAWNFIKPIFQAIAGFLTGTLRVAWIVIQNVVKVVWLAIQVYIKVAWGLIKGYFNAIKWYISNVLAPVFRWLYNNVVRPVWNSIRTTINNAWRGIKVIWDLLRRYLIGPVMAAFRTARSTATSVWNAMKNSIASVYNGGIRPVFDRLRSALGTVRSAFSTAVSSIRKIWDGLKSAAKTPVNFVIGVYNRGIVDLVNKLAGFVGSKTRLGRIPMLARGGTLDNPMPVKPFMTNGAMAIVGEGRKAHPEYVIPTDPRFRSRAQMLWAAAGRDLGTEGPDAKWLRGRNRLGGEGIAFERGGSLQALQFGGIIGKFVDGVKNFTIGNVEKGARTLLDKVLGGSVPGSGVFRNIVAAIPGWIKRTVLGWIKNKVASFGGGPAMERALAWAKTQDGKPYQWGGNGNPSWDCSGFMSAIESVIRGQRPHRRWSTHPFHGGGANPMPGWHRNARSGFMIGVTGAGVGHTAGTLLGHRVESSGSGGVQVDGGARGFNHSMFPHRYGLKFDRGGMLPRGWSTVYNGLRQPEPVFPSLEAAAAYGGSSGPLVSIGEVVVKERADVDLLASRVGFAARSASL